MKSKASSLCVALSFLTRTLTTLNTYVPLSHTYTLHTPFKNTYFSLTHTYTIRTHTTLNTYFSLTRTYRASYSVYEYLHSFTRKPLLKWPSRFHFDAYQFLHIWLSRYVVHIPTDLCSKQRYISGTCSLKKAEIRDARNSIYLFVLFEMSL